LRKCERFRRLPEPRRSWRKSNPTSNMAPKHSGAKRAERDAEAIEGEKAQLERDAIEQAGRREETERLLLRSGSTKTFRRSHAASMRKRGARRKADRCGRRRDAMPLTQLTGSVNSN